MGNYRLALMFYCLAFISFVIALFYNLLFEDFNPTGWVLISLGAVWAAYSALKSWKKIREAA